MTTITARTVSGRLRQTVPATLFVASIALGWTALADAATASAEPQEWDIEKYDSCIDRGGKPIWCCEWSGGVWVPRSIGHDGKCTAPPALDPTQPPSGTGPAAPKPTVVDPSP